MQGDFLKKLFIFVGVIFFVAMIGPYFGLHPLGSPTVPRSVSEGLKRRIQAPPSLLPADDEMLPVSPDSEFEEELDIIEDDENVSE